MTTEASSAVPLTPRDNFPRNLAYEPLDSGHIVACARQPYRSVQGLVESAGKGKWLQTLATKAPLACCSNPDNLDIEAFYSGSSDAAKGIPDVYKFYCKVCEAQVLAGEKTGFAHAFFCVGGGDQRPFWEVR